MGLNKDEKAYLDRVADAIIASQAKLMTDMVLREQAHAKEFTKLEGEIAQLHNVVLQLRNEHSESSGRTFWAQTKVWMKRKRKMDFSFSFKKLVPLTGEVKA